MLVTLTFQTMAHLGALGTIVVGIATLGSGDINGAAWLILGLFGLGLSIMASAAGAMLACRPRFRVDLEGKTLEYQLLVADVVPFAEAEEMALVDRLGGLSLAGPRTELTGLWNAKGQFRFSRFMGGIRNDGRRHALAEVLPTPLGDLSDEYMIVDKMGWPDALRFALYLNLRQLWTAGRTTILP